MTPIFFAFCVMAGASVGLLGIEYAVVSRRLFNKRPIYRGISFAFARILKLKTARLEWPSLRRFTVGFP